ncbi:MAG: hypothetical protein U5K30_16465 [Acidimicrobiales bacterium]|nr:hypothetical protein [Acidimicrobiales bacterium]
MRPVLHRGARPPAGTRGLKKRNHVPKNRQGTVAALALSTTTIAVTPGGYATSGGVVSGGRSILGHPYCVAAGLDQAHPRFRGDLCDTIMTTTRLLFHELNPWTVLPAPRALVEGEQGWWWMSG